MLLINKKTSNHDGIVDNFVQNIKNKLITKKYEPKILKCYNHYQHTFKDELIQAVMDNIDSASYTRSVSPGKESAKKTAHDLHTLNIRAIDKLLRWITVDKIDHIIANFTNPSKHNDPGVSFFSPPLGFHKDQFKIGECWGIHYVEDSSVVEHNHFPFVLSFIYYVSIPKNSGSLFINGKEHIPEEGQLIVFPSNLFHHVKSNANKLRVAIVGNIYYDFDENVYKKKKFP